MEDKNVLEELQHGQLWKIDGQYLQVTGVGKLLIHYKMLRKPQQRVAATKIASRKEVGDFLSRRNALLVCKPAGTDEKARTGV